MTSPTINVNLKLCGCVVGCSLPPRSLHVDACPGAPVLIPCPIPRSVTFEVRLGVCTCADHPEPGDDPPHLNGCPDRPIRVACSISGKTWAESEVTDVIDADRNTDIGWSSDERAKMLAACRDRLALVKALVLGKATRDWHWTAIVSDGATAVRVADLFTQRDAVFAALADMARCERQYWDAAKAVYVAFPQANVSSDMQVVDPGDADGDCPSARWLAAYVKYIIKQVGNLEGGE